MRVGSFQLSDLILYIVNSKLSALMSTNNIECWIDVSNDVWSCGHWTFLYDRYFQHNCKQTWLILDHIEHCKYITWTGPNNLIYHVGYHLALITVN